MFNVNENKKQFVADRQLNYSDIDIKNNQYAHPAFACNNKNGS